MITVDSCTHAFAAAVKQSTLFCGISYLLTKHTLMMWAVQLLVILVTLCFGSQELCPSCTALFSATPSPAQWLCWSTSCSPVTPSTVPSQRTAECAVCVPSPGRRFSASRFPSALDRCGWRKSHLTASLSHHGCTSGVRRCHQYHANPRAVPPRPIWLLVQQPSDHACAGGGIHNVPPLGGAGRLTVDQHVSLSLRLTVAPASLESWVIGREDLF